VSDTTHRQFFGDAERDFCLTPAMILELERKLDRGIGGLCRDLFNGNFRHAEITETIRLALIGAGTSTEEADALVKTYVAGRPLLETWPLAISILQTLWSGKAAKEE
jgi:hypothetical protein